MYVQLAGVQNQMCLSRNLSQQSSQEQTLRVSAGLIGGAVHIICTRYKICGFLQGAPHAVTT